MLLTSNGIRNETLRTALADLLGKRFAAARVVFIATASTAVPGDHSWLVEDLGRLHGLRWREFDMLELNGLPAAMVCRRLRHADVIYVEGGNHYHLANSIIAGGLATDLADILESKVYVGVSAGSMIFSRNLSNQTGAAFGEHEDLEILGETPARSPVGLLVRVRGDEVDVVSDGEWRLLNAPPPEASGQSRPEALPRGARWRLRRSARPG
jgi:dipeptidase E